MGVADRLREDRASRRDGLIQPRRPVRDPNEPYVRRLEAALAEIRKHAQDDRTIELIDRVLPPEKQVLAW